MNRLTINAPSTESSWNVATKSESNVLAIRADRTRAANLRELAKLAPRTTFAAKMKNWLSEEVL